MQTQLVNAALEWVMYIVNDACTQTQICMHAHMHSQTLFILLTNNDLECICNINCRNAEVMIACMWCDIMKQNMSIALIWFTTKCLFGGFVPSSVPFYGSICFLYVWKFPFGTCRMNVCILSQWLIRLNVEDKSEGLEVQSKGRCNAPSLNG